MTNPPPIRLRFGATLWSLFVALAIVMEANRWRRMRPRVRRRGFGFQVAYMILISPRILFTAFLIAAGTTVLLDLFARIVARPLAARWYSPPICDDPFGSPLSFQMTASEAILDRLPARMVVGRKKVRGVLVQTDRRVAFVPDSWDREPWTVADTEIQELATRPDSSPWSKFVLGIPDRVILRPTDGPDAEFLVADPREVLAWFREDVARELAAYDPSPMELL